ncbi:MAG: ABC transporter substrate-binding protein [SAR324 cluster bacterium]|nr:ABC transporter substrate-binding protein [SAR324 cluster bacterium]
MRKGVCLIILLVITAFSFASLYAAESITPQNNKGKKWRIAYYQGGPYVDYQTILKAVVKGLMKINWIEEVELPNPKDPADTEELWHWMAKELNKKSEYVEFVDDAYYNANWSTEQRPKTQAEAIKRFNSSDIDFVLAFGTWAGQDLANNDHSTPIEVISASDPLGAKIVKSFDDSGYDHVHAKIEPTRYEIQVQLFHDIIGFNILGVVYDDTPEGRTYAAIDKIRTVAKERGFKIAPCYAQWAEANSDEDATNQVLECHKKLAETVDAVYITTHRGIKPKTLPDLLVPLNEKKIPTFSQSGSGEVKRGVLLSIAQAGYKYAGEFHAEAIAKVFNGTQSRALNQIFESPPKIAINLAVASIIEYDPPVDILGAADEIYQEIETAQ